MILPPAYHTWQAAAYCGRSYPSIWIIFNGKLKIFHVESIWTMEHTECSIPLLPVSPHWRFCSLAGWSVWHRIAMDSDGMRTPPREVRATCIVRPAARNPLTRSRKGVSGSSWKYYKSASSSSGPLVHGLRRNLTQRLAWGSGELFWFSELWPIAWARKWWMELTELCASPLLPT